jgi:serine/threonine-protein kinase
MEYLGGGNLSEKLKSSGPYNEHNLRQLMFKLFEVLAYLETRNVIHADLKPQNLLL